MNPTRTLGFALALAVTALAADPADATLSRQREEGSRLALTLRSHKPAENLTNSGVLRLRDAKGRRREIPVTVTTLVDESRWAVRYEARSPQGPAEILTVAFSTNQPPRYQLTTGAPTNSAPADLPAGQSLRPFAGTDFWICDLGLEFLHWPDQRLVKQELSNGRLCWTLDSHNPNPGTNGYASVRSWIDAEFEALLRAEAYDSLRRTVKEFSTGNFRKITTRAGEEVWVLKDIRIRDDVRDTRTELQYDLPNR